MRGEKLGRVGEREICFFGLIRVEAGVSRFQHTLLYPVAICMHYIITGKIDGLYDVHDYTTVFNSLEDVCKCVFNILRMFADVHFTKDQ